QFNLLVSSSSTARGSYQLAGGTLTAAGEYVGDSGFGTFTQTGGYNSTSAIYLGAYFTQFTGIGTYALQGGTLNAGSITCLTNWTFTQTGGTLTFGTFAQGGGSVSLTQLQLGSAAAGQTYLLSAGTLIVPSIDVGPGGSFNLSGGTLLGGTCNLSGGVATL